MSSINPLVKQTTIDTAQAIQDFTHFLICASESQEDNIGFLHALHVLQNAQIALIEKIEVDQ